MTEQEAIEVIKRVYNVSCPVREDEMLYEKAIELAIKALEKQIPKKPDFEGDGYSNGQLVYDTWICPYCEKKYEVEYEEYICCPNCGQKLDWGEEE